jgi:hypothetical protein
MEPDPVTGHRTGWLPLGPHDYWHHEVAGVAETLADGTYELCGPKISGNPEGYESHRLIRHGEHVVVAMTHRPLTFDAIREFLAAYEAEGIVFHHSDGERMAKVKRHDFGIAWGNTTAHKRLRESA